jgi:hypothetical protein
MDAWSKAWVCSRSLAGIAVSNAEGGIDVCVCESCVLSGRGLREGADHLSRGVLQSLVFLSVIVKSRHRGGTGPLGPLRQGKNKNKKNCKLTSFFM